MKAKLLPIGLTAIAILATPLMVVSSTRQAQANPLCSQQPNDENCDRKDPIEQRCNDASTALVANITDTSGKVIGEVDLQGIATTEAQFRGGERPDRCFRASRAEIEARLTGLNCDRRGPLRGAAAG